MKLFTPLYDQVLRWSRHPKAPHYLSGLSFAESSFFPIPPDVMLMPMSLARPEKAFYYAWLTTVFSVLGGLLGYAIGYTLLDVVWPWLEATGHDATFDRAAAFFEEYGVWVVFIAGFSPIPYKVFTIAAGAAHMALLPFLLASFVGRGARFFLVAGLMKWGGQKFETRIRASVDLLGWLVVALIAGYIGYRWLGAA
ncbi:MAG: YqaA family protein [Hydrogenovibrio sp.]|uniref:YqaA family protein n=1 Tax=Hydrogenovibrio sp. TaxID=2065821 RepID=UPI00286FB61C|nr:YqaA family protein [Hydrogenovibrio sp.]MDR9497653.1 YqaA family protein [Hydrogenovibrio sp.]